MENDKVVLITGASSGIGRICAEYLLKKGYQVYGTSRKQSDLKNYSFKMISMNVNNDDSVKKAVNNIMKKTGRIDVLINNAGFGISGAIEETTVDKAKEQFETNFFGIHRVCKEILPNMRKHGSGCIINISSIGGLLGLPFQGLYCATKFALEGYSESLRMEVKSFGIKVVLIEPGDIKTQFTHRREKINDHIQKSVYHNYSKNTINIVEKDEQGGPSPIKVAFLIDKIINKKSPKVRYKIGSTYQKLIATLRHVLPDRVIHWILMKYYKLL
jgi:short-subunit dehydrogenase